MEKNTRRGFVEPELRMALVFLTVLWLIGIGVSKLFGLHEGLALIPPSLVIAYVIVRNVIDGA